MRAQKLQPHQLAGVRWLHGAVFDGGGAILADDPGLGKSLQVITVVAANLHLQRHRLQMRQHLGADQCKPMAFSRGLGQRSQIRKEWMGQGRGKGGLGLRPDGGCIDHPPGERISPGREINLMDCRPPPLRTESDNLLIRCLAQGPAAVSSFSSNTSTGI